MGTKDAGIHTRRNDRDARASAGRGCTPFRCTTCWNETTSAQGIEACEACQREDIEAIAQAEAGDESVDGLHPRDARQKA